MVVYENNKLFKDQVSLTPIQTLLNSRVLVNIEVHIGSVLIHSMANKNCLVCVNFKF
jgi:hypothetical protein